MRRSAIAVLAAIAVGGLLPALAFAQTTTQWRASLVGAEEVPPTTSTATGTFTATLDEAAGTLTWTLSVPSIQDVTAAHIHQGARGANGGIVLPLFAAPTGSPAGTISTSGTARAADLIGPLAGNLAGFVTALKADGLYVNVHTTANPGGEIRGQVASAQATATATATATASATAAATGTPKATGTTVPTAPSTGSGGTSRDSARLPLMAIALGVLALGAVVGARVVTGRRA